MTGTARRPAMSPIGGPELEWLTIDDFRVGIVSQSNFGFSTPQAVPASTLPKGAAQEAGTHGCMALPGGGLAPLPGVKQTVSGPPGLAGQWRVNGAFVVPQVNSNDEIVFGLEQLAGGNREFYLYSYQLWNATLTQLRHYTPEPNTAGDGYSPVTGGMTRVNVTDPTQVGNPTLAMAYEWLGTTTGPTAHNWLYPDPGAPTTFVPRELANAKNGNAVCYDNRILVLTIQNYPWTDAGLITNEEINYTDPPNSATMGSQTSVLVQENPFGYGAWGSIAAGELVLIKEYGGAVLVSGDILDPTVTRLQGMPGTGGLLGIAAETPVGLFYASNFNGAWSWNGGNTAQKISQNLADNFFLIPNLGGGASFVFAAQGQFVFVSNDWVYDTVTGGWWRLTDVPGGATPDLTMLATGDGSGVWAVPAFVSYAAGTPVVATEYSRSTPATAYSWKSYPVLATRDRMVAVREIVLRLQGSGTVTVTIEGAEGTTGSTSPEEAAVDSAQPVLVRLAAGAVQGHDLTVQIQAAGTGTGPAPVVHGISVGYEELTAGVSPT